MGFVLSGCSFHQGLESYNRGMYKVNKTVDTYTLKPLAKGYKAITPDPVEKSVNNFFSNIGEVGTFVNSILQGKLHNAAVSSSRIVWNTTLGIGGLFDVATAFNLKSDPEDFGQTLRKWGIPEGPFIMLPLFGPSTITDTVGRVGDAYISPYRQYDWHNKDIRQSVIGLRALNSRVQLLPMTNMLENISSDEYLFVKSAYLQQRRCSLMKY